jgi:hypothetical protein
LTETSRQGRHYCFEQFLQTPIDRREAAEIGAERDLQPGDIHWRQISLQSRVDMTCQRIARVIAR